MSYQVIARKFRPKAFEDVVGQDAIVKTLKNALSTSRLAHAYLFCGLRGTGKTTLARLLAKAMNCLNLTESMNPCGACSSCLDFQSSQSIDFIEIDGASHRGIDDIKTIVDTLTYSSVHKFKIILIDEVHMLTKEAFNALLKTLEEPPEHVKFIFATTEPHKLPSTILSRCQRFDLSRISHTQLVSKLKKIASVLNLNVEDPVFDLISERGEGSLRDAESLFERVIASSPQTIKLEDVYELLGYFNLDLIEELDHTVLSKNIKNAFIVAEKLFTSGKDVKLFFEQYRQHLRHIICMKLELVSFIKNYPLKKTSIEAYSLSEANYLLEVMTDQLKTTNFDKKIECESLILHLVHSKNRASLQDIVIQLEKLADQESPIEEPQHKTQETINHIPEPEKPQTPSPVADIEAASLNEPAHTPSIQEDILPLKPSQFYDTIMQFTAVELEGSLKK
jgi:DNA polymerase III subunit gamma/tau